MRGLFIFGIMIFSARGYSDIFSPLIGDYELVSSYCTGEDGTEDVASELTVFSLSEPAAGNVELDWNNRNMNPQSEKWHEGTVDIGTGTLTVNFSSRDGYDAVIQIDDRFNGEEQWGTVTTTVHSFRKIPNGLIYDLWAGQSAPISETFTTCHSVLSLTGASFSPR
jgi:hypothetical protein